MIQVSRSLHNFVRYVIVIRMKKLWCYWKCVLCVCLFFVSVTFYTYMNFADDRDDDNFVTVKNVYTGHGKQVNFAKYKLETNRASSLTSNYNSVCFNYGVNETMGHIPYNPYRYRALDIKRPPQLVVLVLTSGRRHEELKRLLDSLQDLNTMSHVANLEIWLDRSDTGALSADVNKTLTSFCWKRGLTTVHVPQKHTGEFWQFMNAWGPQLGPEGGRHEINARELEVELPDWGGASRFAPICDGRKHVLGCRRHVEHMALILSDDVIVAPNAYLWLRESHVKYGGRSDIFGYDLRQEDIMIASQKNALDSDIVWKKKKRAFGFVRPGIKAFAPHPARWAELPVWLKQHMDEYQTSDEESNVSISLWLAKFALHRKLLTIYPNLSGDRAESSNSLAEVQILNTKKNKALDKKDKKSTYRFDVSDLPDEIEVFGFDGETVTEVDFMDYPKI